MDFTKVKVLVYLVVWSCTNLYCLAENFDNYPITASCYVQHLHEKGKVDEPPPITVQPQSRCRLAIRYIGNTFIDRFVNDFSPEVADCVKNETVNGDLYDTFLKVHLYRSYFIDVTQLEESEQRYYNLRSELRNKCKINGCDGIKNSTLEDHQVTYCLLQYALDKQLFELKDVYGGVNPNEIDTESIDCTIIVAVERSKSETQFKDKVDARDCAMNEFRIGNLFDWKVAMTTFEGVRSTFLRVDKMVEEFLTMRTAECNVL